MGRRGGRRQSWVAAALALGGCLWLAAPAAAQPMWNRTVLMSAPGAVHTSPVLAAGPDGGLWAAWIDPSTGRLIVAQEGGGAWTTRTTAVASDHMLGDLVGDVALAVEEGRVIVAFRTASSAAVGATRQVVVGAFVNDQWTFEVVWEANQAQGWTQAAGLSLGLAADGTPQLAFVVSEETPERSHALLLASRDVGTWTTATLDRVTGTDAVIAAPALAFDGRGVHVSYMRRADVATGDTLVYGTDAGGDWAFEVVDAGGEAGEPSGLAVAVDGTVQIVYRARTDADVRLAVGGPGAWMTSTLDGEGRDRGRGVVMSAAAGLRVGAWIDGATRELVVETTGRPGLGLELLADGATPHLGATVTAAHRIGVIAQRRIGTTEVSAWTVDLNRAPVLDPAMPALTALEDGSARLTLSVDDPDGDPVSFVVLSSPANGTLTVIDNGDGTYTLEYTPAAEFSGSDSATIEVRDPWGGTAGEVVVSLTATAVNDLPVIDQGGAVSVTMSEDGEPLPFGLMLSATDGEDAPSDLTWRIVGAPTLGTAMVEGDGSEAVVTYVPGADINGTDTFIVEVMDRDGGTRQVVVTVTIEPVNDPPAFDAPATVAVTMSEDGSPIPFALNLIASDRDGDALSWDISSPPASGTASVSDTGEVSYTPEPNVSGEVRFTVRITDTSGASAEVEVVVTIEAVNDAPGSLGIDNAEVAENLPAATLVGTLSATDVEGSVITFALVDGEGSEDNALFVLDGANLVTAEPLDHEAADTRSVRVRATDVDGASTELAIEITVLDRNDPPMAVVLDPGYVRGNEEVDAEVGTLSAVDQDEADVHTFALVQGEGDDDNATFTIDGDRLLVAETLTDAARQSYHVRVEASDGEAAVAAPIEIAVQGFPTAVDDAWSVVIGQTLTVDTPGVLANDVLTGDGVLTATLVDDVTHGVLALAEEGGFTYTPEEGFEGEDRFTYTAEQSGAISNLANVILTVRQPDDMDAGMDADDAGDDVGDDGGADADPDVPDDGGGNNGGNNGANNGGAGNNGNNGDNNGFFETNNGTNGTNGFGGDGGGTCGGCSTVPGQVGGGLPLGVVLGLLGLVGAALWRRPTGA